jgi:two-component system, cell cycle sensor histidine kinase and response regulator CckA
VIDDDEHVRQLAVAVLERHGFEALQASDADEAFQVWAEEQKQIDILLTDVVMPGLHGGEIAQKLLAEKPALKVIFMSGFADETFLESSQAPPGSKFLVKPFAPQTLVELVRKL